MNEFAEGFNEYKLHKILSTDFIQITYLKSKFKKKGFLRIIKHFFFFYNFNLLKETFNKTDILITCSYKRGDYEELILSIQSNLPNSKYTNLTDLKNAYTLKISLSDLFFAFKLVNKRKKLLSFYESLYLISKIVFYLRTIKLLDKNFKDVDFKAKSYIAFNSAFDLETLITQFFNQKGVKTYHLSHGLNNIRYKIFTPHDFVNGYNINSKFVLAWGESSRDDLTKNYLNGSFKIKIAGNPKYPSKSIVTKNTFKSCIVFLARPVYEKYNYKLLDLLGQYSQTSNIKFSIKAHPYSNQKSISELSNKYSFTLIDKNLTISKILKDSNYDFAICFNSNVYYEALYHNLITLRYSNNENEDYFGLDDKFGSCEMLTKKINEFKLTPTTKLNKEIEDLLVSSIGMGVNNYKNIICNE